MMIQLGRTPFIPVFGAAQVAPGREASSETRTISLPILRCLHYSEACVLHPGSGSCLEDDALSGPIGFL
jgi:hypothetical protein